MTLTEKLKFAEDLDTLTPLELFDLLYRDVAGVYEPVPVTAGDQRWKRDVIGATLRDRLAAEV